MRKDAKLAFIVGGILISILVVYVLVVPGGRKKPKAVTFDDGGAKSASRLNETKPPVTDKPADVKTDALKTDAPKSDAPKTDVAKNDTPKVENTPATKPTDPFASAKGADEDKWMLALNHGTVPMMTTSAPPVSTAKTLTTPTPPPPKLEADSTASNVASPVAPETSTQTPPVTIASNVTSPQTAVVSDPAPTPSAGTRTHVVKQGESIAKIAEAVYGSQNYWPYIIRANPGIVAEKIRPGMTLNLPPESEVKAGAAKNPSTQPAGDTSAAHQATTAQIDPNTQYQVQPGDSLHKIAMKLYGNANKWQAIYDLNKEAIGADPAKVKVKSVLKLPEAPTVKQ